MVLNPCYYPAELVHTPENQKYMDNHLNKSGIFFQEIQFGNRHVVLENIQYHRK